MLERKTIAGRQMLLVEGKWVSANKYTQYRGASQRRKAYVAEEVAETREREAEALREDSKDLMELCFWLPALVVMVILVVADKGKPMMGTYPWSMMKFYTRGKW